MTCTCPLGPRVPLSKRAILFSTHLLSIYCLAFTLSRALATIFLLLKNSLVKISSVYSQTLSRRAMICPYKRGFIWSRVAQAVADFAFFTCFSLNKNWRERLEVSMWSGSVTDIYPFAPMLIIAKFLSNSQPIAPAPMTKVFSSAILLAPCSPTTILRFLNYFSSEIYCFSIVSSSCGTFWMSSLKWKVKNCLIGIYLLVIAFIAYWETIPPR